MKCQHGEADQENIWQDFSKDKINAMVAGTNVLLMDSSVISDTWAGRVHTIGLQRHMSESSRSCITFYDLALELNVTPPVLHYKHISAASPYSRRKELDSTSNRNTVEEFVDIFFKKLGRFNTPPLRCKVGIHLEGNP